MEPIHSPLNVVSGRILGMPNCVLVAGNSSSGAIEVYLSQFVNGFDGKTKTSTAANLHFAEQNRVTAVELCGIPRLHKTYAAVACLDTGKYTSNIDFVNIEVGPSSASLTPVTNIDTSSLTSSSALTALAYDLDSGCLAVGSESGELLIRDLHSDKLLWRDNVESTQINKIKFLSSGQIVMASNTLASPAKIVDLKTGSVVMSITPPPTAPFPAPHATRDGFVSLAAHTLYNQVYCGGRDGRVLVWDTRAGQGLYHHPHSSTVTDMLLHPAHSDQLITSSLDGTVKIFRPSDLSTLLEANSPSKQAAKTAGQGYRSLHSEQFGIQALDVDVEGTCLLISLQAGKVVRLPVR
eukprot:gene31349-37887_t